MLTLIGIPSDYRVHKFEYIYFPVDEVKSFFQLINQYLDTNVAEYTFQRQRYYISINCRRGLRLLSGLPCNGQRS